jgi:hypothetical protein
LHGSADEVLARPHAPSSTDCGAIGGGSDARRQLAAAANTADSVDDLFPIDGGAGAVVGVVVLTTGAVGAAVTHLATQEERNELSRCRDHDRQAAAFQQARTQALRTDARQLTRLASEAARSGDCERARRLEGAVDDQDPTVHDMLFVRDPDIRRCLTEVVVRNKIKTIAKTPPAPLPARPPAPPSPSPAPPAIAARNPIAATLTRTAYNRAIHHDCATVRLLEKRVRELDAAYHKLVFLEDPTIARCSP